ncbi:MAG TPA: TetR/AcrR family transcriptional regulator [Dermatophilaceae bacterium]|nr:TetR/AcrR family transcriptional regulator [Dermatophilaceae bacterium]
MPSGPAPAERAGGARTRLAPDDRRRQLVGIGLRKFVERPVQELSLDEVAAEAGVSRGLLFHYFPTKTAYFRAVVAAAERRVLRNVAPGPGMTGDVAVEQVVRRFVEQVARRRESYLALVYGRGGLTTEGLGDSARTLRVELARLVGEALALDAAALPVVHGWVAYVEDRALQWSADGGGDAPHPVSDGGGKGDAPDRDAGAAVLARHCVAALHALLAPGG